MRADFGAFLDQADAEFLAGFGGHLLEADGRGQAGGAAADDHYVVFHDVAGHV